MSSPNALLKATLSRVAARLGNDFMDRFIKIVSIAQKAPEKFQDEWKLFKEEVILEADRLDREANAQHHEENEMTVDAESIGIPISKEKVDRIRTKVMNLSRKVEEMP